ncbi:class I adenylate-forming enzyme family protein [Nonomuraea sediminis]|uniref:class I adenylate-forming enzyme family protein n=1 Tax=Nonomuraea sediminis TaxID=2835864 RepID=UPI001BDC3AFC|nr:class I adenylate-forming enzyme family protein [Nonomuraea sediminis]
MSPSSIPRFLTDYAPTRFRRRFTPFSRTPATARMGEIWHVAAERNPGQLVIVDRPCDIDPHGPTTRTYAEWAALVDRAAAWLHAAGVRAWDRVVIMKANHLDVALLGCAAARIGAVPAMLSGTFGPEHARILLQRLERPFLVTDAAHVASCDLTPEVVATTARTITVDDVACRTDLTPLRELMGGPAVQASLRADHEPMVITHTSGTTGVPKLVMHSAASAYSLALVEAERWPRFRLRADDVVAFCDPYCHQRMTTGMAAMATVTPRMIMLSEPRSPRVRELLREHRPTVVETLPNIYLAWEPLAREAGLFDRVRLFINSFDAIHTRTIRTFLHATRRRMPIWVQSWSQSENGALVIRPYLRRSVRRRGHRPPPTQLLGWPIPSVAKIRAVDPDTGRPVRRGQVGLIEIAQPGRCLAYVGEMERHDLKRDGNWWNTGDLGVINRWGAVRLVDREIDRIPGASAIELEDVLLDRLPRTTEVVILPVSGGLPVPVVSADGPLDPAEWKRATADLPALAEPIQIRWEDFPRTGTWKIRRVQLREQLLTGAQAVGIGRWT